jgi:hypothetical protein
MKDDLGEVKSNLNNTGYRDCPKCGLNLALDCGFLERDEWNGDYDCSAPDINGEPCDDCHHVWCYQCQEKAKFMKDSLDDAVNNAAKCLPDGWHIEIYVEKGSASVKLVRPDEVEIPIDDEHELSGAVFSAIEFAKDEVEKDHKEERKLPFEKEW